MTPRPAAPPTPVPLAQRYASALAANLIPVAGVLFLGWSAAPALFFLWLDTLLCNLRIVAPTLALLWNLTHVELEGGRQPATRGFKVMATPFVCLILGGPALGVGTEVYDLMQRHHPAGPLAAVFSAPAIWAFIALALVLRGLPIAARMSEAQPSTAFRTRLANEFLNLLHRSMVIMLLALLAQPLGHWGLVAFLVLAAAFLSYVDLHENWLQHLEEKAKQWGEAYRARRKA